uniref:Glucosamine/galactosamine-6-phosphate isomerase domain-containing protein n=2 Tax=Leersia perrieri TaxID=77586 RepID=A0A0D9VVA7_9ORYZ
MATGKAAQRMERESVASYEPKKNSEIRILENSDEMATELAEYISQVSEISVKERGYFAIALSGGPLVRNFVKHHTTKPWIGLNGISSGLMNERLERTMWIVPILNGHVYSINDNETVEDAATDYEFVIRQLVKIRTVGVSESNDCPKFDLILLSIDSDGHIASLFPNHPALDLKDDWVTYIIDSPDPPPERITFTLPVINSASNIAIVATGEDKAKAVYFAISEGTEGPDAPSIPARMVQPTDGKLLWFLDKASASFLEANNDGCEHPEY